MNTKAKKLISISFILLLFVTLVSPTYASATVTPKLNKSTITAYKNKTITLKVTNTSKKVTWTSSNKTIATVDKNGKVTTKNLGVAYITAKVGTEKAKCKVNVKSKPKKEAGYIVITNKVVGDLAKKNKPFTFYVHGKMEESKNVTRVDTIIQECACGRLYVAGIEEEFLEHAFECGRNWEIADLWYKVTLRDNESVRLKYYWYLNPPKYFSIYMEREPEYKTTYSYDNLTYHNGKGFDYTDGKNKNGYVKFTAKREQPNLIIKNKH